TAADSPQGLDATAGQAGRRSRMGSVAVPPGRSHPAAGRCALAGAGPVAGEGGIGGYCLPGCRCTWLGGSGAAGDRCPVAGFVPGMRAPLVRPGRTGGDPVSRRPVLQPASQSVAQVDGADAQRRGASAAALAGAALLGGLTMRAERAAIVAALCLVLAVACYLVYGFERTLRDGQLVLLELAPV